MLAHLPAPACRGAARLCAPARRAPLRRASAAAPPPPRAAAVDEAPTTLPKERTAFDALSNAAPSWGAILSLHATATARAVGRDDAPSVALKSRALAASRLGPETAWEVMDSVEVVSIYSGAYDGDLASCTAICDTHARLLADCLLTGAPSATTAAYAALEAMPPMLRKQHTSGTAAVGAAALLALREDAELLRTMLAFATEGDAGGADEEARAEAGAAAAMCAAVDAVVAAMPQPPTEEEEAAAAAVTIA
jgi:hypothetical protein